MQFLGDAVLVCFQSINNQADETIDSSDASNEVDESEASVRQKNLLVRRGVECGLQLLARLSHYTVYLTAEERSKHRTPDGNKKTPTEQTVFDAMIPDDDEDNGPKHTKTTVKLDRVDTFMASFMKHRPKKTNKEKDRRTSNASNMSIGSSDVTNSVDLELHMALSCGNVTNIIVGDLDPSAIANPTSYPQVRSNTPSAADTKAVLDEFFLEYHGRLEYTIGGDVVDSLDDALSIAKAGEMSITPAAYDIVQQQAINLTFERRRRFFVIRNITEDLSTRKSSYPYPSSLRRGNSNVGSNANYLKTLPGLTTQAATMSIEPLIPRVRNTYQLDYPVNSNRFYLKYINRSALYRMQHSIDDNLPAQFREVTIMFVSLGKTDVQKREGLAKVQKAVVLAIKSLVKYEGMLQQFAIDDKGKIENYKSTINNMTYNRCHIIVCFRSTTPFT